MAYNTKDVVVKLETSYDISDPGRASVAAIGSHMTLGNWDENRPLLAINTIGNQWEIYISARAGTRIYWKWVIYDLQKKKVLLWEDKIDVRELVLPFNDSHIIVPWNKTQNIPLSLYDCPSGDPYESIPRTKSTARHDKEFEQASTHRSKIGNPGVSQPKITMPYLGNISVGNNDYISLFQTLSSKYSRQNTVDSSTVHQGLVQEHNAINPKMAPKVAEANLNVSSSKFTKKTEVEENGNTFKTKQKGLNPNHNSFLNGKGNSAKMSGDHLKLKMSIRDKLSRISDRKRSQHLQRRTRFTACRQSKSLFHTKAAVTLDNWNGNQGFIGNPIVGVIALCVVCYSIYTKFC